MKTRERRRFRAELVRALHRAGHPVAIALVQDRRAVLEPGRLARLRRRSRSRRSARWSNRSRSGTTSIARSGACGASTRCRRSMRRSQRLQGAHPARAFYGPRRHRFRVHIPVLARCANGRAEVPLSALSHHLYVDRRGAPENPQGPFGTVEKLALAARDRAARPAPSACGVTEMNWPLAGTGAYSPVNRALRAPRAGADGRRRLQRRPLRRLPAALSVPCDRLRARRARVLVAARVARLRPGGRQRSRGAAATPGLRDAARVSRAPRRSDAGLGAASAAGRRAAWALPVLVPPPGRRRRDPHVRARSRAAEFRRI